MLSWIQMTQNAIKPYPSSNFLRPASRGLMKLTIYLLSKSNSKERTVFSFSDVLICDNKKYFCWVEH